MISRPDRDDLIEISCAETAALLEADAAMLVDVREPYEWEAGRIEGAVQMPLEAIGSHLEELNESERRVVVYCRVGGRSYIAAEALRSIGIDAKSMSGGIVEWDESGLPLAPEGSGTVADH